LAVVAAALAVATADAAAGPNRAGK